MSADDQRCYDVIKEFNESAKEISYDGDDIVEFITDIDEAPSVDYIDGSISNLVVYDALYTNTKSNQI